MAQHDNDTLLQKGQEKQSFKEVYRDSTINTKQKIKRYGNIFTRFIKAFDEFDTTYITPNRYNWAFMLQNTNSFEFYKLQSQLQTQRISFSPRPAVKIGPYIGWRWIFLGYTFEVNSLGKGHESKRTEFELSLYSSMLGCDLIYRSTGDDFHFSKVSGFGENSKDVEGHHYDGIHVKTIGANAYYIFNHKHFSYPAAFAQSTVQRKSCGTWKAGISITRHEMSFDYAKLPNELTQNPNHPLGEEFKFNQIDYTDFSLSCGYAYNWVFARNWLFCISIAPAVGYKKTHTSSLSMQTVEDQEEQTSVHRIFNRDNFNIDFTGRTGLVWNNTKYFGGISAIVHNYNYRRRVLDISNTFGTINVYFGLNFQLRKQYR